MHVRLPDGFHLAVHLLPNATNFTTKRPGKFTYCMHFSAIVSNYNCMTASVHLLSVQLMDHISFL